MEIYRFLLQHIQLSNAVRRVKLQRTKTVHSHWNKDEAQYLQHLMCMIQKTTTTLCKMIPTENKRRLENTFWCQLVFPCSLLQVVLQNSGRQQSFQSLKRITDLWAEFTLGRLPCSAPCCSLPPISHPDSSQALVPVWWAASATCPYSSSHCPRCRGCAGEYNLSQSPGSGISRSAPVSGPGGLRSRSSRSAPTPSPGRCSDGSARACPNRARLARAEAPLGWRRRGQSVRRPPPRDRRATGRGPRKCRGNQLHTGASAGGAGLRGEGGMRFLLHSPGFLWIFTIRKTDKKQPTYFKFLPKRERCSKGPEVQLIMIHFEFMMLAGLKKSPVQFWFHLSWFWSHRFPSNDLTQK